MHWTQNPITGFILAVALMIASSKMSPLPAFFKSLRDRIFPKPIHGVFYTQESIEGGKIVRRYVDGKLSAKRSHIFGLDEYAGTSARISDWEFRMEHGEHKDVVKQLRLREE